MKIIPATVSDAKTILALQKLAYPYQAALYDDYEIPPLIETLSEMEATFQTNSFLKAVHDKTLIGSVRAYQEDNTCHIGRLIVHPDYQNQGIGTRLMAGIEDRFPTVKRFELFTGHKSMGNIHLYEKLGYVQFKDVPVHERLRLVYLEKIIGSLGLSVQTS
ncbi:GNAT family N-acetyltransferase [Anaerolineales bacterium HSG25]|nr:GNAT family N-acetyltransferase [Anaerolineales bacterium HSG25]